MGGMCLFQQFGKLVEQIVFSVYGLAAELTCYSRQLPFVFLQSVFVCYPLLGFQCLRVALFLIQIVNLCHLDVGLAVLTVGNDMIEKAGTVQYQCRAFEYKPFLV